MSTVNPLPCFGAQTSLPGYVQGMSDLCAPVYVVMDGDEEMTFWCFVKIMERMVRLATVQYGNVIDVG